MIARRIVAACALVAGVAACTGNTAPRTITIGALYPTTGAQGMGGRAELEGVRLAVEYVNEHGGVNGRTVRLVSAHPERIEGVPDALATLHGHGANIIIGSHGSSYSAVAAQQATRLGVSFWETGAVGELPAGVRRGHNFFRLAPSGATLGRAGVAFVDESLQPRPTSPRRFAVAYVDDAYGRAVGLGAIRAIEDRGLVVAAAIPYDAHHLDARAVAQRIRSAHADVLYVSAYLDDGVAIWKAVRAAHIRLAAAVGTSSSFCMPEFGERLGAAAVRLFASDKPDGASVRPEALTPAARARLTWIRQRVDPKRGEVLAPTLSGFSNALVVLEHVLVAARSTDVDAVARAAHSTRVDAAALPNGGGYELAPDDAPDAGENRLAEGVVGQWVAPRRMEVVWPAPFATHAIVPGPVGG